MTTCLVGHPSIEATPAPAEEPRRRDKPEGSSLLAGTNLRIAHPLTPTHQSPPSPKYWTPTVTPLDTDSIRWPNILNGNLLDVMSNVSAQRTISS